jgi:sodium-dependent dicarboxylate transporter 2/3/5
MMAPAALAASMAFMLPVATPPNAIVFGSGMVSIRQMARAGFVLNVVSIILTTLAALLLVPMFLID